MIQNLENIPRLKTEMEQIDDLIKRFGESFKVTVQVGCFYYPHEAWNKLVESVNIATKTDVRCKRGREG